MIGDVASIVGVIVGVIGFSITIYYVWRSRTAAQQAERAVLEVREDITRIDTMAEFASALTAMEEIKRLHRQGAWSVLPDRYSALRRSLISIRGHNPNLSGRHKAALQSAIQLFTGIEQEVEQCIAKGAEPPDAARLNHTIALQVNRLQQVLAEIRTQIGGW